MDKLCSICFEDMDMLTYNDEHDSTSTCFKLNCGHSFHTKCIIECLQKTNQHCPNCHGNKDFELQLTREGILMNLIKEVKKDKSVKKALQEYKNAKNELSHTIKQLKRDTVDFSKKRKEELEYDKKHKYFLQTISNVKSSMKISAKEKGPKFETLFGPRMSTYLRSCQFERFVLNAYGYNFHRLKFKKHYIQI